MNAHCLETEEAKYIVNELNNIEISGVKLGYWFAQQGSIYVFIILIFIYIKLMMGIDKKYGFNE
mgnify:CR=1 FL=1